MKNEIYLSPVREMCQKYGIRDATLRLWIRSGLVLGRTGKPALVHEPSLVEFIEKQANGPLRRLLSGETCPVTMS